MRILADASLEAGLSSKDRQERPTKCAPTPRRNLLRVQPSGLRTYYVRIGRGQRVRIGAAGTYTLEQAKERRMFIGASPRALPALSLTK